MYFSTKNASPFLYSLKGGDKRTIKDKIDFIIL